MQILQILLSLQISFFMQMSWLMRYSMQIFQILLSLQISFLMQISWLVRYLLAKQYEARALFLKRLTVNFENGANLTAEAIWMLGQA